MEISRREKNLSSDSFSFPSTPTPDSDFEFGCLTPESSSTDPCITSPADHLFFNGRLLPHSFPSQTHLPSTYSYNVSENSRTTSRTSSTNSKGSLMSSRSNSTNSRSSCSSARTSSSDNSERRKMLHQNKVKNSGRDRFSQGGSCAQLQYGCSNRWQYITAVPSLSRETSRRSKVKEKKTKKDSQERAREQSSLFGRRFLKWFVSACKQCHALEPSRKEKDVLK